MKVSKIAILALLAVVAVAGWLVWTVQKPADYLVQGEVEATRIDLSAQVTGRVAQTPVGFGDRVRAGDVVVLLESPQLSAKRQAAQAGVAVAQANRDLAFSTRPETIAGAEAQLRKAEADMRLAESSFERVKLLREDNVASQANYDQASNAYDSAVQGRAAAQAQLDQARNGASAEQKAVAEAQLEQAKASFSELQTMVDELTITSPIAGQVTARPAEVGKLFSAGAPLISIVDVDHAWLTFNLREDLLQGLRVGQPLRVQIPALGPDHNMTDAVITAINVEGSYANWRATKATGDFDLRTFSVRAQPTEQIEGLRPGMSALVDWPSPAPAAQ